MVTRTELLQGWPEDQIVTVCRQQLDGLKVPDAARRFLSEVGLPRAFEFYFTTIADRFQDPTVDVEGGASLIGRYTARGVELLRIGSDYGGYLCVEPGTGHVVHVTRDGEFAFINTSIEAFAACLLRVRMRQVAGGFDGLGDDELEARSWVFLESLRKIDPAAVADDELYWSVVVEQMGYGHL